MFSEAIKHVIERTKNINKDEIQDSRKIKINKRMLNIENRLKQILEAEDRLKRIYNESLNINEEVYNLAVQYPYSYNDVIYIYDKCGHNIERTEKELINMTRRGVRL